MTALRGFAVLTVCASLSIAFSAIAKDAIVNPYPIDRLVGPLGAAHALTTEIACPAVPAPIISLKTESRYDPSDRKSIRVDKKRAEEYRKAIEPVRTFIQSVVKSANRSIAKRDARRAWASCAIEALHEWAAADALSQMETSTAILLRGPQIAALSLALLQTRDAGDEEKAAVVAEWLARLAHDGIAFVESRPEAPSSRANHRYWNGLAAAAAGAVADDQQLVDWGIESARLGLSQVTSDGFLPLELARGPRARNYHLYAVAPLVLIAEFAALSGVDLYAEYGEALPRLARASLAAIDDPSAMSLRAGSEQRPFRNAAARPPKNRLAWLEPYALRVVDLKAENLLAELRPVSFTSLGGDLTLLFSAGLAEPHVKNE